MCTSFTFRGEDILTAMNFDNNGMKFKISTSNPNQFIILVNGAPCFGVNSDGVFINQLVVDANDKGQYRRGKNVVHTIKLIKDILGGKIKSDKINDYLDNKEVVNVPDYSAHCMITDSHGNSWAVEPGRGKVHSLADKEDYFVMTNFSLCDLKAGKEITDGYDRYLKVQTFLNDVKSLDVNNAFRILEATRQLGNWSTDFSMVYSKNENTVYYCYNGNFNNIERYSFGA